MNSCVKCGAELNPGAKFCIKCGTPLVSAAAPSVAPSLQGDGSRLKSVESEARLARPDEAPVTPSETPAAAPAQTPATARTEAPAETPAGVSTPHPSPWMTNSTPADAPTFGTVPDGSGIKEFHAQESTAGQFRVK